MGKSSCEIDNKKIVHTLVLYCNCSAGLRIYCADRKKTYIIIESKNPIGTAALEWILRVTVRC